MLLVHLYRLFDLLRTWYQRHQTRQRLRQLDANLRRDIGVSAKDAEEEAGKPFWRA